MEDKLKVFLEKFAELERRVRRLAAEDRARVQEASALRDRLSRAEKESARLKGMLDKERASRRAAKARVEELISRLSKLPSGVDAGAAEGMESGDES